MKTLFWIIVDTIASVTIAWLIIGCAAHLKITVNSQKPITVKVEGDTLYISIVEPDNYVSPKYGWMDKTWWESQCLAESLLKIYRPYMPQGIPPSHITQP